MKTLMKKKTQKKTATHTSEHELTYHKNNVKGKNIRLQKHYVYIELLNHTKIIKSKMDNIQNFTTVLQCCSVKNRSKIHIRRTDMCFLCIMSNSSKSFIVKILLYNT